MHTKTTWIVFGALAVVVVVGLVLVRGWIVSRTAPIVTDNTVDRPELRLSFTLPSGDAYTYIEPPTGNASTSGEGPEGAFIIVKSNEYSEYQNAPEGREAPRSMSIFVFPEPVESTSTASEASTTPDRFTKIRTWAEANTALTSYARRTNEFSEEVEIDGVKALHYKADGLYMNDIYVAFYRDRYYLIVGQYDGEADPSYAAFKELVNSILFS